MMAPNSEDPGTRDPAQGTTGSEPLQTVKEDLSGVVETVKEQTGAHLEQYKDTAADQIESLAQNAQTVAQQMEGKDKLGLSRYVADIAGTMTSLADDLRNKNAEQLLHDASRLARDNPLLFLAGSVALGLGLSRLLKASATSASDSAAMSPAAYGATTFGSSAGEDTHRPDAPIGSSTLAAEEMAATHPHDDVLHSARPGMDVPDRPIGSDRAEDMDDGFPAGGAPRNPL